MQRIQIVAAWVALISVIMILVSTAVAVATQAEAAEGFLSLTKLVLSWPVAAGGLVFGGGQGIIRAWKTP